MIRFYNTLTRKKEDFQSIEKNRVKMYHCGPTVYGRPHIGNYRAFLLGDLLRRFFEYKGFEVVQVMNLTDVDDKTIRGSQKEDLPLGEFTEKHQKTFFGDLDFLKIQRAHHYPKATEHISQMVDMVKSLQEKGLTYKSQGSIYYKINAFEDYGRLARLDVAGLKDGARVDSDEYDKESPRDFALWKAWVEEDGDVFWETELGKGRPGWHIECSAMSTAYLGDTFDIHTGGIDLVFPHHENEIAQSQGATGKPFVHYWLHNEHFLLNNKKISKSLGNVVELPDLIEDGYSGEVLRYALISPHYRTRFNFQLPQSLVGAREAVKRLQNFRRQVVEATQIDEGGKGRSEVLAVVEQARNGFDSALEDDLNMPSALGAVFSMIRKIHSFSLNREEAQNILDFLTAIDQVLMVIGEPEKESLPHGEIEALIEERNQARKDRDFQRSDEIRDELKNRGILLEDTPRGTRWKRG